jgi:hypothetical protein
MAKRDKRYTREGIPIAQKDIIDKAIQAPFIIAAWKKMQREQPDIVKFIEEMAPNIQRDYGEQAGSWYRTAMTSMYSILSGQGWNNIRDDNVRDN